MSERDMKKLLDLIEKHLGTEWQGVIDWLRGLDSNSVAAIEARLIAGDYAGLLKEVDQAAKMFAAASHQGYEHAGREAAKWLDEQPGLADRLVRFDATNDRAVYAARRNELELAQGLSQETRQNVRQILVDGQRQGLNPRTMARDIRDSIGLTPTQESHVRNYRRALETGDYQNAMQRELHDDRANTRLRRLSRDGGQLTEQQIDTMTERYRTAYVEYRTEVIARTESAKNVHAGIQESFRQAIERGDIDADQLVKEWIPGPRTKDARPAHRSSALLDQRPAVGDPFVLADGVKMQWPGDPSAPVAELANCRCTFSTTFKD
jgi:hypothetical protein